MMTPSSATTKNGKASAGSSTAAAGNGSPGVAVPHLSVAERVARGKAARAEVPRASHAVFEPSPSRADPVELLERQAKTRVPELVPIRYGRMLVSPFTFYRGAALIMANDLGVDAAVGADRAVLRRCAPVELRGVRLAGAAAGVRSSTILMRRSRVRGSGMSSGLAVSMLIAARDNGYRAKEQERIVLDTVGRYRTAMAKLRRDEEPRSVVLAPGRRERDPGIRLAVQAEDGQADREARSRRRARRTA